MRKVRRIGGPVRVSTSDCDLDELTAIVAVIARSIDLLASRPPHAPLDQQFEIDRAPFIVAEAVVEGMAEAVEAEMLGAAVVGAVEEGTMMDLLGHKNIGCGGGWIRNNIGLVGDST